MMKNCKENEVLNPITKRCVKINSSTFKKIDKNTLSEQDKQKLIIFTPKCKEDQVYNPITKRCIKKNGATHKALLKSQKTNKSPSPVSASPLSVPTPPPKVECKNDNTFLMFENVNKIPKNDFIKLSNGYCFSIEELTSLLESDTFNNLNPHNQAIILFDLVKDEKVLKEVKLYEIVESKIKALKKVNKDEVNLLHEHLKYFYQLCKLSGLVIFDNLGSFSSKSDTFNLSLESLTQFNDIISKDKKVFKLIYSLKHPKTKDTVKNIIENCNKGTVCIHKAGSLLLQIFIHWFMKLEQVYNIKYDVSKGKIIFTRIVGNRLYFRQVNSKEIHDNGSIYISDLLIKPDEFEKSSLYKERNEHKKYKCEKFKKVCVNNEDLYLYTNNYEAESWCDIKDTDMIKLTGNYCFGLDYILEFITNRLNSSNMNNPQPAYPVNPFTNLILSKKDLKKIKKLVLLTQTKVTLVVKVFLEDETFWHDPSDKFDHYKMVDKFEKHNLRFKRINSKDSQDNYNGYWTHKNTPTSIFEKNLFKYMTNLNAYAKNKADKEPKENITYENLPKFYLYS